MRAAGSDRNVPSITLTAWGNWIHGDATDGVSGGAAVLTLTPTINVGFNTDPAEVAARSGTVILIVDFSGGEVTGTISLDGEGDIQPTSLTLRTASISGNQFAGDVSLTPADFAASSLSLDYSGVFHEQDAAAVGIELPGSGVHQATGEDILAISAFGAEQ